jgi:hypothetical protein
MKKLLKFLATALLTISIIAAIALFVISEKKPEVKLGSEADKLATEVLKAINKDAFDTLKYLQFDFGGRQKYFWHKPSNTALIEWKENKVIVQLDSLKSKVLVSNNIIEGEKAKELTNDAWSHWCNDSFWMLAPFKLYDPGTERSIVEKDGAKALMIKYSSGGVTPGDEYLWYLDENNIPTKYQMWVKIIPIGGTEATWENWITLKNGAKVSTLHKMKVFDLIMSDVKEGDHYSEFGYTEDPLKI